MRLIHAGRLQPIEEALAALGGSSPVPSAGSGAAPPPKAPPKTPLRTAAPTPVEKPPGGNSLRSRLHAELTSAKRSHLADALENSEIAESGAELVFTTPKMYQLYLKDPEFEAAVRRVTGRPVKITIKVSESVRPTSPGQASFGSAAAPPAGDEATAERALAHPEVQRFQELFPGSHVRAVRNLRENEA